MKRYYPKIPAEDSFTLNYYRSAHALVVGLQKSKGRVGAALQGRCHGSSRIRTSCRGRQGEVGQPPPGDPGPVRDADQPPGKFGISMAGYVPNVDQTFGGTFGPNKPAPSRAFPP